MKVKISLLITFTNNLSYRNETFKKIKYLGEKPPSVYGGSLKQKKSQLSEPMRTVNISKLCTTAYKNKKALLTYCEKILDIKKNSLVERNKKLNVWYE